MTTPAPHNLALVAAIAALGGAVAVQAASASTFPANGGRPHSRVVTYDRDGVRVQRLQMAITATGHLLHATVHLGATNQGKVAVTRQLRVGSCTGGAPQAPSCPAGATVAIRLAPGQHRDVTKTVTLRESSSQLDTVEATLGKTSARAPYLRGANAELLLRSRTWRRAGPVRTYGVAFASADDAAKRLSFDIPAVSATSAYIDAIWSGSAAPDQSKTTISRCKLATCTDATLPAARQRSHDGVFGNRFDFNSAGADALKLSATSSTGKALFDAALPWPT